MKGILSGFLIGVGGTIYLTLMEQNKIIGAFLFCIGLISVCCFQLPLFTGKVGYLIEKKTTCKELIYMLLGNIVGAFILGVIISFAKPELNIIAQKIIDVKNSTNILITFLNSILCGVLMFIAVDIYKEKNSYIGILFAIPVFILAGFEHSIAYVFYAGAARTINIVFLLVAVIGNSLGGFIIPLIKKYC